MNALLPIIEELADALDDPTRARWLLKCPRGMLMTYQGTIRNRLQNAFFVDGVAYLDAELTTLRSTCTDGLITLDNPLRTTMVAIAAFAPADPTDL